MRLVALAAVGLLALGACGPGEVETSAEADAAVDAGPSMADVREDASALAESTGAVLKEGAAELKEGLSDAGEMAKAAGSEIKEAGTEIRAEVRKEPAK